METVNLKSIADIQVGYQTRTRIEEKSGGGHWLIQGRDFDSYHRLCTENMLSFLPDRKPELYAVHKGDILFQSRGMENFAYCIEDNLKNTLASGSFYIIRLKTERLLPQYLAWWLNQSPAQIYLQSQASSTVISFVSKGVISQLNVPIPPLEVQHKVNKVLNLWLQEKLLHDKLTECRSLLVKAVCMKAIQ